MLRGPQQQVLLLKVQDESAGRVALRATRGGACNASQIYVRIIGNTRSETSCENANLALFPLHISSIIDYYYFY